MIKWTETESNGPIFIREYFYDANGNLIKIVTEMSGDVFMTQEIEYKLVYLTYDLPEFYQEVLDEINPPKYVPSPK